MQSLTSDPESRPESVGDAERRAVELLATTPAALLFIDIPLEHAATRRLMMSHLIHHRAQLGVYLRLLGVPLVGMYGPSADDGPPKPTT